MRNSVPKGEYLGKLAEDELDEDVRGLLSFDDCPTVLRASGLSTLMRQFGKVYASSRGSARTYRMSEPVTSIKVFLSHNWVVPRTKKFLCLAVHFNWVPAAFVTSAVLTVAAVLTSQGYFPVLARYKQLEGWKDPAWREGIVCTVISFPVFLLVVLFWRDILWLIGWRDISAFLDKTCIHQEDEAIMRMGIERLGAFVNRSEQMLVLYTETYLRKMWTTYEVASFLTLHGAENMRVLPVRHAVLLLVSQGACWLYSVCLALSHEFAADYKFLYVVGAFLAGFYFRDHRKWEMEKKVLEDRVKFFQVEECTCAVESDREIVYRNISRLMRASKSVHKEASQEEALEAFNLRVRSELMGAFKTSLGRNTFRFHHYLTMGWFLTGGKALDMLVSLHLGLDPRYVVIHGLYCATWVLGIWIIIAMLIEKLASFNLHLRGWKSFLWHLFAVGIITMTAIINSVITGVVKWKAETSNLWLVLCILMPIATAALAAMLLNGLCCGQKRRSRRCSEFARAPAPINVMPARSTTMVGVTSSSLQSPQDEKEIGTESTHEGYNNSNSDCCIDLDMDSVGLQEMCKWAVEDELGYNERYFHQSL